MIQRLVLLSILAFGLVLSGCSGSGQPAMGIATTSLPSGITGTAYSVQLQAIGGKAPFTWELVTGVLPKGLSLSGTGAIAGMPEAVGVASFTVKVTDASHLTAQLPLGMNINSSLSILTTVLPAGVPNQSYHAKLQSVGGALPVTWAIVAGALPAGMAMDSGGTISGTPTASGTTTFTVGASDLSVPPQVQQQVLTLTVGASAPPVTITTTSLPGGMVNSPYSATLQSSGGFPPVTWSVVAGTLPAGLSLDPSSGVISGRPTAAGTSNLTVQAMDNSQAHQTAQTALSIMVNPLSLTVATTSLPGGTVNTAYNTVLLANGGTPPVKWTVSLGALPAGLTLNTTTGAISGTPTTTAATTFSVAATDSGVPAQTVQQTLSINVIPAGVNTAELKGQYAFLLQGFDATGPVSIAGSFTADGLGNLTGGLEDINRRAGVTASLAFTGTYLINADQRGTMTLTSSLGTSTFAFAWGSIVSGVASLGHVIEFDTTGTNVTGVIKKQDPNAFSVAALNGNYAMGMNGASLVSLPFGLAGSFTANGLGVISAGSMDTIGAGPVALGAAFTGTYTVAATGRGTSTLTVGASIINQVFYVISANELLIMGTDPIAIDPVYGGSVAKQTGAPFTNASLNGTSVLTAQGADTTGTNSGVVTIQVGVVAAAGAGTFTFVADGNKGGVLGPISGSGTYSVAPNGRMPITEVTHSWVVYLVAPNEGFLVDQNPSATTGRLMAQTGAPFTNASLSGSFIAGDGPPVLKLSTLASGVVTADGIGTMNGTLDLNSSGVLTPGAAFPDLYTAAPNGRVVLTTSKQIVYMVSPTRAVSVSSDPTLLNPNLRIWDK